MKSDLFICGALTLIPLFPTCVHAQGVSNGAAEGAAQGRADGGTVGAVIGGVVAGVDGLLGVDQRPDFRDYVECQHHPSNIYRAEVREGNVGPRRVPVTTTCPPDMAFADKVLVDPMDR